MARVDYSVLSRSQHTLHYHSAAIFAAALETSTLIYRSCHAPHNMSSMANTLTKMGRKVMNDYSISVV